MKYILSLIFSLISVFTITSQSNISDKTNLARILQFANSNLDSLVYYTKEAQKSTDPFTKNVGIIGEASAYYKKGNFKTSKKICLQLLTALKTTTFPKKYKILLTTYNRLFWITKNQGNYARAFQYLIKQKEVIEQIPVKNAYYYLHKLSANTNIASIKSIVGLHSDALNILKKSNYELRKLKNDKSFYYNHLKTIHSSNLNTIGNTYFNLGKDSSTKYLDSASLYYLKAYQIAQSFTPPHKNSKQLFTLRKIKVLTQKGNYTEALQVLQSLNNHETNQHVVQDLNYLKSTIFFNLNKIDSTIHYATKFLKYHKNTPNTEEHKIEIYHILANLYGTMNTVDSAYKYSTLERKALSTLTANKNKINSSHYKYSFNKLKKENKDLITSNQQSYLTQIIVIGLISLLLIILLLYRAKKTRQKTLHDFDLALEEIQTNDTPIKKDYNIEKELEQHILIQLSALENSKDFLDTNFSLKVFAKKLNTNTTYVSYIINNTKNQSFKHYITKLRINYLIDKLKTEEQYLNYTIQYLAEEIGYTNASAFTRAFKKEIGTTPSTYIKSLKK